MILTKLRLRAHHWALLICLSVATALLAENEASPLDEIRAAAEANRYILAYDGDVFAGPGWDKMITEGRSADFFLIGEEHGIAENPRLVAQLFTELANHGYTKLAIEISPPMATVVDSTLRENGLDGLRQLFSQSGGEPAFFGMKEEAELLAAVRRAVPANEPALWGTDYEVASDRILLAELERADPPDQARAELDELVAASRAAWDKYDDTGSPQYIFSFSGDPALVTAVRDAWTDPSPWVDSILRTLEETLRINKLWVNGDGYNSNVRRGTLMRQNFLAHWQGLDPAQARPKVMAKYGASHLVRGRNMTETFDLGALLPELAAIERRRTVSIMVLPGIDSMVAVLDPSRWQYVSAPAKDNYAKGLEPVVDAAYADKFTLIDLAPLRSLVTRRSTGAHPNLLKTVTGFDYLLVMSGSTPSSELAHD